MWNFERKAQRILDDREVAAVEVRNFSSCGDERKLERALLVPRADVTVQALSVWLECAWHNPQHWEVQLLTYYRRRRS